MLHHEGNTFMKDFGSVLRYHRVKGTRPQGVMRRWGVQELAGACGVAESTMRNWINNVNPPTEIAVIENVLFGDDPAGDDPTYAAWRRELQAAHAEARKARKAGGSDERLSDGSGNRATGKAPPVEARFSRLPARVPTHFIGRERELAQIATHLLSAGDRVATVILFGMRGVGKTTLVAAYADAHRADYRVVWSIRGEAALGTCEDLKELGLRLGLHLGSQDPSVASQAMLDYLAQEGRGVLLIFDNALNSKSVATFLPRGGECHVVITSNSHAWRNIGTPIKIEAWSTELGARFLVERTGEHSASSAAERLSIALDGLPLAHEIAAAYCEHKDVSIGDYLENFSANPVRLLSDHRHSPVEYYGGIAVTRAFEMAIEAANQVHPACGLLMSYASHLPDGPIPHCLFTLGSSYLGDFNGAPFTDDGIVEALGALKSFALINDSGLTSGSIVNDDRRVPQAMQIHRLIRIVSINYGIKSHYITESPEDTLIDVIKTALGKCDFFDNEPMDGRTGNYNTLIDYLHRLDHSADFAKKLSPESKKYLTQKYEEHVRNCQAWPH